MNVISFNKNLDLMIHTYRRKRKKIIIVFSILFAIFFTYFSIKILSPTKEMSISKEHILLMNREVKRILKTSQKDKFRREFKKVNFKINMIPIHMTQTTAVCKFLKDGEWFILKRVIYHPTNDLHEDLMSKSLRHPHICKTLASDRTIELLPDGTTQTIIWLLEEYLDVIVSQSTIIGNEDKIRHIMHDALLGLVYLHSQNIAHLDLKIANIMGKTTKDGIVYKIIDFGYTRQLPESGLKVIPNKSFGTFPYKPPEIVFKNTHCIKSDIWSLGAICWFLSLQRTLFHLGGAEKDYSSYRKFLRPKTDNSKDNQNHIFVFHPKTSKVLKDFVKTAMQVSAEDRPTALELLQHPFITGIGLSYFYYESDSDLALESSSSDSE